MQFFKLMKDGGPQSRVWGYFLAEIKSLCSVVLINFKNGSRDAFHSHAFNSISWLIYGRLIEEVIDEKTKELICMNVYNPSIVPIITKRSTFHKVTSVGDSWLINFRGPWSSTWKELTETRERITLTSGRKVLSAA